MNPKEQRKHFIESLYETLDQVVDPTPYIEITEGERLDVQFLDGKGNLPKPNTIEVTCLDMHIASLFFDDFNLLQEGITGVGKTYTADALSETVFGFGSHYTVRLGGGLLAASALEPFTATRLEDGIPKMRIDHDQCQKYGSLHIDEINRGDTQEVFQAVDGIIYHEGDVGYLRIPIPGTDRFKKLVVFASMNPADAQHSSALELDLAGENRFLKFTFPNGVEEAGASQLDKRAYQNLHDQFWDSFRKKTGMKGTWRDLYPLVADPETVKAELHHDAREFIDVALGYVSKDPIEVAKRNTDLLKSNGYVAWRTVNESNAAQRVREAQKNLKHGFVRRDLKKIHNFASLLGFIKGVKTGTYDTSVSLYDIAAGMGIVLESKKITGSKHGPALALVNIALHAYKRIRAGMGVPANIGIRELFWQAAMYAGHEQGFDAYNNTIIKGISNLNTQARGVTDKIILSRLAADLAVLGHFSNAYKSPIEKILRAPDPKVSIEEFRMLYEQKKAQASVYAHRLSFIQG
ncbi:MAG: hypothetical protein Q8R47_00790 [Nanoarchaeota archaeon]|nr:hypothetical protein [Nanoarchaeota archaeon]